MTGKRYSEALTWLKQAKVLALPDKQAEIDDKWRKCRKGIGGKPVRYGTTANAQATAGSTTNCIATGGSPGTAIPERRANPDVLDREAVSGSATRLTTANASTGSISRTAANAARTIRAACTTTARYPVPSTGTDAATADRRKAMDATGSVTVCTGAGGCNVQLRQGLRG